MPPSTRSQHRDLPGLRSLEGLRAILDMGNHELILPGAEPVPATWPTGTIRIPLQKAPSGHLVMVVDDFERAHAKAATSALPERTLTLHADLSVGPGAQAAVSVEADCCPKVPARE